MAKLYFPQYARGREGAEITPGSTILEHISRIGGVEIDSECGGEGSCCKDVIRIDKGADSLNPVTDLEKALRAQGTLRPNQRLACQTRPTSHSEDIVIYIPNFGRYTILTDFIETTVKPDPCVYKSGDAVYHCSGKEIGPYEGEIFGLAVDIGTTTLVMQLIDLETGRPVGKPMASKNPQIAYGNDIISRIGYTIEHEDGLDELQEAVAHGINNTIKELGKQSGNGPINSHIYEVVVVGNSTMRDIFLRHNVKTLGLIPFESSNKKAHSGRAGELCLDIHPQGFMYAPPLIGGHAGADCLADIIATDLYKSESIGMIIDIGTNGEIVLGNKEKMITASCAAGGAYEGYQIKCGVGAIQGAITEITLRDGKIDYKTLAGKPALGVCGSGVIDLLAELLKTGVMNEKARIQEDFYITDSVHISQEDINQLIIAKAGLRTDQELLIQYYGISVDQVEKIYLAGAFGNYMNIDNAMRIGLLPEIPKERFIRFGNGALAGAIDMLISREKRQDAENVLSRIHHTKPNEIEGDQFQYEVAENIYFV
jgi:uncharacterized 2Fe-2S/4Fe-4S cluster protein (DUF4445 family)